MTVQSSHVNSWTSSVIAFQGSMNQMQRACLLGCFTHQIIELALGEIEESSWWSAILTFFVFFPATCGVLHGCGNHLSILVKELKLFGIRLDEYLKCEILKA